AAFMELREFLLIGGARMRWLLVALHQAGSGILDVFTAWRARRLAIRPDLSGFQLRNYYTLHTACDEFLAFTRERVAEFGSPAVEALLAYHEAVARAAAGPIACTASLGPLVAG